MVAYSFTNGALLGRRFLNMMFGKQNRRPTQECWDLERFVGGMVIGSDFEFKEFSDWAAFVKFFGAKQLYSMLGIWYAKYQEDGTWAVVEKQDDTTVWAYFNKGVRKTEWVEL